MVRRRPTLLIVSQVYSPDRVGRHVADVAEEMVRRGWRVVVLTSGRGYNDPTLRFPAREMLSGVEVVRLPASSLGKKTLAHRVVAQMSFAMQAGLRSLVARGVDRILLTTSPPLSPALAWAVGQVRRVPITYWMLDMNPDQAVGMGMVGANAPAARALDFFNRGMLRRASDIVVLDRFMADRLRRKGTPRGALHVVPPWPHDDGADPLRHVDNPWRQRMGFGDRFVLMYSGNHSPAHSLDTILQTARRLSTRPEILFCFVGDGGEKEAVDGLVREERPTHVVSLPSQPLAELWQSLSAADVHLVSMGDAMVGCSHPSKFYGAMAVARPILAVGPQHSHVTDVLDRFDVGWSLRHGDVDGVERAVREAAHDREETTRMGERARGVVEAHYSRAGLLGRFTDLLEGGE